jgi:hypothetical protein
MKAGPFGLPSWSVSPVLWWAPSRRRANALWRRHAEPEYEFRAAAQNPQVAGKIKRPPTKIGNAHETTVLTIVSLALDPSTDHFPWPRRVSTKIAGDASSSERIHDSDQRGSSGSASDGAGWQRRSGRGTR